jgi:uncharacterized repeat protein (TIGR01451 family)
MKFKLLIFFIGLTINSLFAQYNGLFQSNNLTYLPDGTGVQYQDSFVVTGLPSSAIFLDPIYLNSVCVEMEHSYIGDLEMWVECPNGQSAVLINSFDNGAIPGGISGGGVFLGHPYDDNGGGGAGTPFTYCFSTNYNALSSISNNLGNTIQVTALNTNPPLSAGNSLNPAQIYAPETSFSSLVGCPLNGTWKIKVQDNLGIDDGYIFGWNVNLDPSLYTTLSGRVFNDLNQNCSADTLEAGVEDMPIIIQPGNIVAMTNHLGIWYVDNLPAGNYTFHLDTTNSLWNPTCSAYGTFSITDPTIFNFAPDLGLFNEVPCPQPEVSIFAPFLRRCLANTIYVAASNGASTSTNLSMSYVDIELDPLMTVNTATYPYQALGNNIYRFQTGDIFPGQTINFSINFTISCDADLNQTLCMEANLNPVSNCALDTISTPPYGGGLISNLPAPCTLPWDQSSLSVDGWCQGDSVVFQITNTGEPGGGDMECFSPVIVYVDGTLYFVDSIMINGGQTVTYSFPANGETWILNAEQHPLHPGNSHPNAHVDGCGPGDTDGDVNDLPLDDADPVVDIYCGVVTGSYDPNDKRGFPNGVTEEHFILPNQQIQYVIRFQNTGTDTAFTVVVRDTLDINLDILSVTPGVSSHDFEFKMYGPRVLEWTFNNINLPDSANSEPNSHGFLTFTVNQKANLSPGTVFKNNADIYFDLNEPIITNETWHTINLEHFATMSTIHIDQMTLNVYPNPTTDVLTVAFDKVYSNLPYSVYDQNGRLVKSGELNKLVNFLDFSDLNQGFYLIKIKNEIVKIQVLKK